MLPPVDNRHLLARPSSPEEARGFAQAFVPIRRAQRFPIRALTAPQTDNTLTIANASARRKERQALART